MRDEREMMRRGGVSGPLPATLRPQLSPELAEALELFNIMGGLEWGAIPIMFALYEVKDPERMITRLAIIRDALNEPRDYGKN